jgi:DNA/RNA-binding domain of Phe-tRNA-synthetase-like protein
VSGPPHPLLAVAPEVARRFPGLEVRCALLEGLDCARPSPDPSPVEAEVRALRTLEGLKDDALFRAYRDFFWALGIDPTKSRPSGEALNRRVLQGKPLPRIHAFVDAYNLVSLRTGVPIAAFDADALQGMPLALRPARAGEGFVSIGGDKAEVLQGHELVVADAAGVVAFYPHRDHDRTKVTRATRRVLLVACGAPGVPPGALDEALALAVRRCTAACGGRLAGGRVSGATPSP